MGSYFITGTNTDVGKTVVTAILAAHYHSLGKQVIPYKPIQSGATIDDGIRISPDVQLYQLALPSLVVEAANTYLFTKPSSPHLAAREEKVEISIQRIIGQYKLLQQMYEQVLVEGAGGLFTPLNDDGFCIIHLIKKLNIPVILVASSKLGTINQTVLSIMALQQNNIPIAGIILNQLQTEDPSIEKDNETMIEKLTGVPIIGVIPFIDNLKAIFNKKENVQQLLATFNFNKIEEMEENESTSTA